jgi:hypothetical protein
MLQFNLQSLFGLTIGAAVLTWILFVLPGVIGNIFLLSIMVIGTSALIAGVIYFRGYWQAFCIGALPPQVLMVTTVFFGISYLRYGPPEDFEFKVILAICLTVTFLSGLAAAGVRYLATRPAVATPSGPRHAVKFPGVSPTGENPFSASDATPQSSTTLTSPLNPEP